MAEKGSILLIDDDSNMEVIARRVFTRAGFEFLYAKTAEEGFQLIRQNHPDLILLDYMLPDMDGEEFLRRYQEWDYPQVPVVMLTCRADKDERVSTYFRLGLKAFLVKPFGHRELVAVVENILQRERVDRELRAQADTRVRNQAPELPVHELREVAASLEALAHSLLQGGDGDLTPGQQVTVMAIYNGTRRLHKLLEQFDADDVVENSAKTVQEAEIH